MNFIVDDIEKVVNGLVPGKYWSAETKQFFIDHPCQYLYGHKVEVTNRLLKKQQNNQLKDQLYPLIVLFLDIEEPIIGDVINYKLNLVIVAKTNPNDNTAVRYQDTKPFKLILYPLFEAFMKSLSDSGLFFWPTVTDKPKHTKIDRPFWGKAMTDELGIKQTEANIFNDYLDAIQIKNLEVNQKIKTC